MFLSIEMEESVFASSLQEIKVTKYRTTTEDNKRNFASNIGDRGNRPLALRALVYKGVKLQRWGRFV
jgi:hypothetical protein